MAHDHDCRCEHHEHVREALNAAAAAVERVAQALTEAREAVGAALGALMEVDRDG